MADVNLRRDSIKELGELVRSGLDVTEIVIDVAAIMKDHYRPDGVTRINNHSFHYDIFELMDKMGLTEYDMDAAGEKTLMKFTPRAKEIYDNFRNREAGH